MADNLMDYLSGQPAPKFSPSLLYSEDGDFITYFFSNAECYGHRVDDLLTVYLSVNGDDLVGCKVKGVARIVGELGSFGMNLNDLDAKLSLLFMGGAIVSQPGQNIDYYRRLAEWTKQVPLSKDMLKRAA